MLRCVSPLAFIALTACRPASAPVTHADTSPVRERVQELLVAYGSHDADAVLRLCDPEQITVYGSDVSEVVHGGAALRAMMTDDFALWGTARFGEPRDVTVRESPELATAFFDVPFQAGTQPEVIVRMATVWQKRNGAWLLTASSNVVPTKGSSARELLHR